MNRPSRRSPQREPRPFLGVLFRCCKTYGRIYRNKEKTAYAGFCPRCGKRVVVAIGSEGTDTRFFVAS
jgi:hypothetical protein